MPSTAPAGWLSVEHAASGGRTPRNFSIDPTGQYVFSSNQDTENIVVLRIDRATGRLTPTGMQVPLANPGSIGFSQKVAWRSLNGSRPKPLLRL